MAEDDFPSADFVTLAALSQQRIRSALDSLDVIHGVDDDGDLVCVIEDNMFWFFTAGEEGEIFVCRAAWKAWLPLARRVDGLESVNEWNDSNLFPSASLHIDDDGDVGLKAMRASDFENGVTDAQLLHEVQVAIATSLQFFEALDGRFPDAVETAQAYRDAQDD